MLYPFSFLVKNTILFYYQNKVPITFTTFLFEENFSYLERITASSSFFYFKHINGRHEKKEKFYV